METFKSLQINTNEVLPKVKKAYLDRLDYIGVNTSDLSRFSWTSDKKICIYILKIHTTFERGDVKLYLTFAIPSQDDSIKYFDFYDQTNNFEFEQITNDIRQVSYLVEKEILERSYAEKIIASSLANCFIAGDITISKLISGLSDWVLKYADSEYSLSKKHLEAKNIIENFPISNKAIFVDKYHFNEMLMVIDDDQFTDEFNQCLFAYENEKWFLCAAGIGSCLEHLMLLTLTNYGKEKQLGRNPTASNYLKAFTKDPLNIEPRQQTYIDTLFRLRNSVDHHNSGYTSKGICDMLLDGVSSVFNEYYEPSKIAKKTSQSN
mgnify:CR=1 FL=1